MSLYFIFIPISAVVQDGYPSTKESSISIIYISAARGPILGYDSRIKQAVRGSSAGEGRKSQSILLNILNRHTNVEVELNGEPSQPVTKMIIRVSESVLD
jgi:hypothetical protein